MPTQNIPLWMRIQLYPVQALFQPSSNTKASSKGDLRVDQASQVTGTEDLSKADVGVKVAPQADTFIFAAVDLCRWKPVVVARRPCASGKLLGCGVIWEITLRVILLVLLVLPRSIPIAGVDEWCSNGDLMLHQVPHILLMHQYGRGIQVPLLWLGRENALQCTTSVMQRGTPGTKAL